MNTPPLSPIESAAHTDADTPKPPAARQPSPPARDSAPQDDKPTPPPSAPASDTSAAPVERPVKTHAPKASVSTLVAAATAGHQPPSAPPVGSDRKPAPSHTRGKPSVWSSLAIRSRNSATSLRARTQTLQIKQTAWNSGSEPGSDKNASSPEAESPASSVSQDESPPKSPAYPSAAFKLELPSVDSRQTADRPSADVRRAPRIDPGAATQKSATSSLSNPAPNGHHAAASQNKMHQTSSRLLRMTDEERPYTRDFKDLFSTLMVSLPLTPHRVRFTKIDHTFTSEEAINNLGSLKFSQSNRMPDPKDPSRIVTTTTTTTFSMAKEMARSVCQRFMDARFIEPADGKQGGIFPLKGALWQMTPKGMHILQRFCQRNGINSRHIIDVLESQRNQMHLVILERDPGTDKVSHDRATVEVIFRRFVGQEGPNIKNSTTISDSDSAHEYYNGLVGVKMARERKVVDRIIPNTFTGKATVDWLMDCCTTVDRRETYEIAELFVQHGLMYAALEDKVFTRQNLAASRFQPTKEAIFGVTEKGERVAGWRKSNHSPTREEMPGSSSHGGKSNGTRTDAARSGPRDSNNNRLNVIVNDAALRLLFREYLRDTHCEENLSFYIEVREFTRQYDISEKARAFTRLDAIRENLAAAYGLYNAFLAPGSPCELNIDHNLRNSLAARMTRAVGDDESMLKSLQDVVGLFKEAQTSVFKLMSSDSVPKFLKEPRYAHLLREHNFDPSTSGPASSTALPERTLSRTTRDTAR